MIEIRERDTLFGLGEEFARFFTALVLHVRGHGASTFPCFFSVLMPFNIYVYRDHRVGHYCSRLAEEQRNGLRLP